MIRCYIGLGSNLGPSKCIFNQTLALLQENPNIFEVACSKYYETTPVNCTSDRLFLNAIATFTTTLSPQMLFSTLEEIESKMGKRPKEKNADRLLDIDLLFYGDGYFSNETFTIPHPSWQERLFVVQPLSDLLHSITLQKEGFSVSFNILNMVSSLSKKGIEKVIPSHEENSQS